MQANPQPYFSKTVCCMPAFWTCNLQCLCYNLCNLFCRGPSPDSIVPMGYAAYALEERLAQDAAEGLQEYAALQDRLLARTQRAGTFLAGYLLLTVSGTVQPPWPPSVPFLAFSWHTGDNISVVIVQSPRVFSCMTCIVALGTRLAWKGCGPGCAGGAGEPHWHAGELRVPALADARHGGPVAPQRGALPAGARAAVTACAGAAAGPGRVQACPAPLLSEGFCLVPRMYACTGH